MRRNTSLTPVRHQLALSFEARQVHGRIGPGARALRLPDHFTETFQYSVQRLVRIATRRAQPLEVRNDAGRLIDRELLRDRNMQRQVQERVDVASFGTIVAIEVLIGLFRSPRDIPDASKPVVQRFARARTTPRPRGTCARTRSGIGATRRVSV